MLAAARAGVRLGVANEFEESLARNAAAVAELASRRAEAERIARARALAAAWSSTADLAAVELVDPLPPPPEQELAREEVVGTALRSRLDLLALEQELGHASQALRLEQRRAWPETSLGVEGERPEGGGTELVGPGVSLTLPVFDRNRAAIARAEHRVRALAARRDALASEVALAVRSAVDRAAVARRSAAFARSESFPAAEHAAGLARRAYELGEVTLPVRLEAERALLETRRAELDARHEAALAWSEVERAAGVPLEALGFAAAPGGIGNER
jgi:cobalt-zinc-cadmium efflux system outer membrane protein